MTRSRLIRCLVAMVAPLAALMSCTNETTVKEIAAMADTTETPAVHANAVRREGARAYIADVPRPTGSCSSLASLAAVLQQRGEKADYTYLMGVSGRAFRLQFSWCPSAPHAYVGFNCFNPALRAVGYERRELAGTHAFLQEAPGKAEKATEAQQDETRRVVKAEVDAGRALIFGSEEDGVLVGYEPVSDTNGTGWLCRPGPVGPPPSPDEPYVSPVRSMPWGLCAIRRVSDPMPRREAAVWALKTAVLNAERETVEGQTLKTGFAAWDKWIDELQPEPYRSMVDETKQQLAEKGRGSDDPSGSLCLGNAWSYENLYFARYEAAKYLRRIAPDMPEAMRPHLLNAADAYERVQQALVPEGECFTGIAPYPWMMKDTRTEWTDAKRKRQRDLLNAALSHERAAVDALRAALTAIGEPVPRAGGRVIVRGFETGDWRYLQDIGIDQHATGGTEFDHPWPTGEAGAKDMAAFVTRDRTFRAVCLNDSGRVVGLLKLGNPDSDGRAELGHMFRSDFRDGPDTEAIRLALAELFADDNVMIVFGHNAPQWKGQVEPLTALGFRSVRAGVQELPREAWREDGRR